MCDDFTEKDNEDFFRKQGLTRREFNQLGMAAVLAMVLPPVANAMAVVEEEVLVETPDGKADCYFVHPATGAHAGVIIWPDNDCTAVRPSQAGAGAHDLLLLAGIVLGAAGAIDDVTVTLDHTPMGDYVEVEGMPRELYGVARMLGLDPLTAVPGSYVDLWQQHRSARPELGLPGDMVFGE